MTALHATKLVAAFFGGFSALSWAVAAGAHWRWMRRLLRQTNDAGLPWFTSTMNAWAAGTASVAALAQVFLTLDVFQ
jgi:hypothetical protein